MTEAEWLACDDPKRMLRLRRTDCCGCFWMANGDGTASLCAGSRPCVRCPTAPYAPWSDRKLRLFACACCRQVEQRFPTLGIDDAELVADGDPRGKGLAVIGRDAPQQAVLSAMEYAMRMASRHGMMAVMAALLRDIVGNPFRPVTLRGRRRCVMCDGSGHRLVVRTTLGCCRCDGRGYFEDAPSEWLTSQVVGMVRRIYDERDFSADALGVLADALEDADCPADGDLVRHLRGPGPHVRGCWALDLILGKE